MLFRPELIIAPYLRRAIPESVWSRHLCLIVHPGVVGDRGPSALDWAIQSGAAEWGVTVLQAEAEMDAGPVWASASFPLRAAKKSSIYRNEVTQAACSAVLQAIQHVALPDFQPYRPLASQWRPLLPQAGRAIDWRHDDSATVLRKIAAADGFPGVADSLFGQPCHLFDAWRDEVRRFVRRDIAELVDSREPQLLAGIVTDPRAVTGQRGRVVIFKLDDGSEAIEAVAGEEIFEERRELAQEDQLIVVQGRLQPDRFSGGLRLNAVSYTHLTLPTSDLV